MRVVLELEQVGQVGQVGHSVVVLGGELPAAAVGELFGRLGYFGNQYYRELGLWPLWPGGPYH